MQVMKTKRLFFGFSVHAPWPQDTPAGRVIEEKGRHITLAFLGNTAHEPLEKAFSDFPKQKNLIGPVGKTDSLLFLPKQSPRVVAEHVKWLSDEKYLEKIHQELLNWLENLGHKTDKRPFLPHITVARAPFDKEKWEESFHPLPLWVSGIHLYESSGNLQYNSLWQDSFLPPFEEFEHMADIAFHIRGKSLKDLYLHGAIALSFKFPPFIGFLQDREFTSIDQVIQGLNQMVSQCDLEIGCPFKAVSYHGKQDEQEILTWEMIVDV